MTGGASGLGRGTVEYLVKQGGKAVICDLPTSKGQELSSQLGADTVFVPVDVGNCFYLSIIYFQNRAIFFQILHVMEKLVYLFYLLQYSVSNT